MRKLGFEKPGKQPSKSDLRLELASLKSNRPMPKILRIRVCNLHACRFLVCTGVQEKSLNTANPHLDFLLNFKSRQRFSWTGPSKRASPSVYPRSCYLGVPVSVFERSLENVLYLLSNGELTYFDLLNG